jgi:ribosome-associated protein
MASELVSLDQLCKGEWNMVAEEPRSIRLDQFLKFNSMVGTGGQAKLLIQEGLVRVNGEIETRRRRKLRGGDVVEVDDQWLVVEAGMEP